jgi:hypothetical protein
VFVSKLLTFTTFESFLQFSIHPYWVFKDAGMQRQPKIRLNAGYLDGRVEAFNAWDARGIKNYGAQAFITPKYR